MARKNNYTRNELINELLRFIEEYKVIPTVKSITHKGGFPSYYIYKKEFGSWENALNSINVTNMISKSYTKDELIAEIHRFISINGRQPLSSEMYQCNGYISLDYYYKMFGTWNQALIEAGIKPKLFQGYTKEILIKYLQDFVSKYDRIPTCKDFNEYKEYPNPSVFATYFGTWNNALKAAELSIHKSWHKNSEDDICSICGSITTSYWYLYKDNDIICSKCHDHKRDYYHGVTDPNSYIAIGIITEHVVYEVLGDCIKCNTKDNFNAPYDLISEKYGIINVKSAALIHRERNRISWNFEKKLAAKIPNVYICIGFDETKTEIQHVWIIPGNSKLVANRGITISLSRLERASEYEVDPTPYNTVYQNLDIYTLPEFRNLPRDIIDIKVPSIKYQEVC